MHVSEYDGSKLRLILIGMITDTRVCSRIASVMDKPGGPRFEQKWADMIAKWCRDHLKKYNSAPNQVIEVLFKDWAHSSGADAQTIDQVESLLDYMSSEYSGSVHGNTDFVLDLAANYFNERRLKNIQSELEENLTTGNVNEAYRELASASRIELGYSTVINPLRDIDSIAEIIDDRRDRPIFEYPGDLGTLVGPYMTHNSFFAFQGIEKVGKSYYMMDAAYRALKKRKRVAYFEVGDLGKDETLIRLAQRALHEPTQKSKVDWPIGWDTVETEKPITEVRHKEGISIQYRSRILKYTRGRDDYLRISCHPNSSINVNGIESYLQEWARADCWIPDMVVIDYADILAPPDGRLDITAQVDMTWKQLRRLSQTYNCLVLTATQSGAQAYRSNVSVLTKKDFQGRRTKYAEVDGMLGLNATDHDSYNGVTRVNWIVRRKGRWSVRRQVAVAGCLACAMPIIHSKFVEYKKPADTNGHTDASTNGSTNVFADSEDE